MNATDSPRIRFLGATGTVTGSRHLVEYAGRRVLVDCGMFQGLKQLRLRNWAPFPVPASSIDAVVLTHAHIDHSGFLPRLVQQGFRGTIHATPGTADLIAILLPDSGRLQEEDARYANRHGFSKHSPALPLYTEAQALHCLKQVRRHAFGQGFEPIPGLKAAFSHAGHIIGAASVHLDSPEGSITFSGDLGRDDDPVMQPPAAAAGADIVVVESTYGDRRHSEAPSADALCDVIARTAARGGTTLIPAFAVGRAQAILHAILSLKAAGRIPDLPIYLNSPMATQVTRLVHSHADEHRLTEPERRDLVEKVRYVRTEDESRALNHPSYPSVIVAASGMATGGRVLHHLEALAPDPRNTIAFAGFQAAGTRGATLLAGADSIRLHGQWVPVRAEVAAIEGMSSHADQAQLLAWLGTLPRPPRHVYVTHGEPQAADALRQAIEERLGWPASVPEYLDTTPELPCP
ncbi:metallo-beta-lactamase family protein [Pelomonas saccharophila]|uniref:Metallo-beta-lactamase family protein n=1 Tax=Roseateles saccharophilus TaxID=304 RepID=A0ABU1YN18_ROSSA|nr:MBL fold metallo-hydrolase [Roseateles saccharophilus]MDR7270247.1 metallo-beta-lactamase family protein [Roseateles saccharophilus]